jgi:hypothetical protein
MVNSLDDAFILCIKFWSEVRSPKSEAFNEA